MRRCCFVKPLLQSLSSPKALIPSGMQNRETAPQGHSFSLLNLCACKVPKRLCPGGEPSYHGFYRKPLENYREDDNRVSGRYHNLSPRKGREGKRKCNGNAAS